MKRILIIDDDVVLRQILKTGLEEEGFEVYELESGRNAVKTIKEQNIDLVTLDIFMDDQEGIETLLQIRNASMTQPVLIISSNAEYLDIALTMGAKKTLQKPFILDDFLTLVNEMLATK